MKDKLPSSFVIKHHSENPLWDKYIKWLNETYEWEFEGTGSQYYYGYYFRPIVYRKKDLPAEITILTLDQWHKLAYPEYEVVMVVDKPSDKDAVLQKAIDKWGEERQLDKVIEEMSELTKAILKLRHADKDNINQVSALQDLAEEHADVLLTLGYLSVIFGAEYSDDLQKRMAFKLEGLKQKL